MKSKSIHTKGRAVSAHSEEYKDTEIHKLKVTTEGHTNDKDKHSTSISQTQAMMNSSHTEV